MSISLQSGRWRRRATSAIGIARLLPSYLLFGVMRHLVALPTLARWAWRSPAKPDRDTAREERLVAWVVRARRVFERDQGDCLQSSLLLYRILSECGAKPMLVVGFRRVDDRVDGHAWIVVDGAAVAEASRALASYQPALVFGDAGDQLSPSRLACQSRVASVS